MAFRLAISLRRSKRQALTSCLLNLPEKASRHHDLPVIALCKLETLHLNIQAESAANTHLRPILGSCSEGPYLASERTLNHHEITYLEDITETDSEMHVNEVFFFLSVIISQFYREPKRTVGKITDPSFPLCYDTGNGSETYSMRQNTSSTLPRDTASLRQDWRP